MAFLADLFSPTFLMFLGILVLVVALHVVYYESKIRDQNHKIASMLSLVSTLAEDMNCVKMRLNHLAIRGVQPIIPNENNLGNLQKTNLIEVSDDEETDENGDLESVEDNSDNNSEDSNNDIKVVKLQVSNEDMSETDELNEDINNLDYENEDLPSLDGDFEHVVDNDYVEEVLDLKYSDENKNDVQHLEESNIISSSDLKTISINLGEQQQHLEDNIDYKKLQLAKLKSIAIEKGLISNSEALKLKKPELLKLLGAE